MTVMTVMTVSVDSVDRNASVGSDDMTAMTLQYTVPCCHLLTEAVLRHADSMTSLVMMPVMPRQVHHVH